MPKCYSLIVWQYLVLAGAKPCGFSTLDYVSIISSSGYFNPSLNPDTFYGSQYEFENTQKLKEKYKKTPLSKKPNIVKLKEDYPFNFSWVVNANNSKPLKVIRDLGLIDKLSKILKGNNWAGTYSLLDGYRKKNVEYLLKVKLTLQREGRIKKYASLYTKNFCRCYENIGQVVLATLNPTSSSYEGLGFINLKYFTEINKFKPSNFGISVKNQDSEIYYKAYFTLCA
ncbi:MAG: Ribonucleases P/MRP protein subunit pop1 [Paramarteilia canceri]